MRPIRIVAESFRDTGLVFRSSLTSERSGMWDRYRCRLEGSTYATGLRRLPFSWLGFRVRI